MCSLLISFIFINHVSINKSSINGSALYRDLDNDNYNEILFKGFLGKSDALVTEFNKNSILQVTGRIIVENNLEYLNLIQATIIEDDAKKDDLPQANPLVVLTAPYEVDTYKKLENIQFESFFVSRTAFNGVTANKINNSKALISYTSTSSRFSKIKDHLKKTILTIVGKKVTSSSKVIHVHASEIEFNYPALGDENVGDGNDEKTKKSSNPYTQIESSYSENSKQKRNKKRSRHEEDRVTVNNNDKFIGAIEIVINDNDTQEGGSEPKNDDNENLYVGKGKEKAMELTNQEYETQK